MNALVSGFPVIVLHHSEFSFLPNNEQILIQSNKQKQKLNMLTFPIEWCFYRLFSTNIVQHLTHQSAISNLKYSFAFLWCKQNLGKMS